MGEVDHSLDFCRPIFPFLQSLVMLFLCWGVLMGSQGNSIHSLYLDFLYQDGILAWSGERGPVTMRLSRQL